MNVIPRLIATDVEPCTSSNAHTKIVLKEGRGKVIFTNPNGCTISIIKVDAEHCIARLHSVQKADYALLTANKVWYVELKGGEIGNGIQQLKNTVLAFENLHTDMTKICIITAGLPKYGGGMQRWIKQFKNCGATLTPNSGNPITLS